MVPYPTQSQNQFNMSPMPGMLDLRFNPGVVSVILDASSAGGLLPGQAVKLVTTGVTNGDVPHVIETDNNTDAVWGFIVYSIKDQVFNPGMKMEVAAMQGCVMYMIASAPITRGAQISIAGNFAEPEVVTSSGSMVVIGQAYDGAAAAGQLIRGTINLPGFAL